MKKFYFLSSLVFSVNTIAEDYSVLKIAHITAKDNQNINESYESGEMDGFFIKTTKGLLGFSSSTEARAAEVLIAAKPTQCIKVYPNIDTQIDRLIYGVKSAQIIPCSAPKKPTNSEVNITNYGQILGETQGLKVVDFVYNKKTYTYRVYCQNHTVRNVSNNGWSNSRLAYEEDKLMFNGKNIVSQVTQRICQ